MLQLKDLGFRAYVGKPIVVDLRLSRQTLEELTGQMAQDPTCELTPEQLEQAAGNWDFDAPATLVWPRVDHEQGIVLTPLCPCRLGEGGEVQAEPAYDLYTAFGLSVNMPAVTGALDANLIATTDWDQLPEPLKDHTRWLEELSEVTPGVRTARADERLDPWRDASYPDIVQALLFVREGVEPTPLYVRVERPAIDEDEPDEAHWEATIAQVDEGGCELGVGDGVWLGIARGALGEALGTYALPQWKPSAEDYDEERDRAASGDLSLTIGARYYREGMATPDDEDHEHRIASFRLAERFYLRSAEQGNVQAMCNLGYIYGYGRLGEKDAALAAQWYKSAADAGQAEAAYKYGDQLAAGTGVGQDLEQAYFYYELSYQRAQGDDEHPSTWGSAALRLAECLERGRGCEPDLARARDLYLEAESGLGLGLQDEPWYGKQLARARAGSARLASL